MSIPWTLYIKNFIFLSYYLGSARKAKGITVNLIGFTHSFDKYLKVGFWAPGTLQLA